MNSRVKEVDEEMGVLSYMKQEVITSIMGKSEYRKSFIIFFLIQLVMLSSYVFAVYNIYHVTGKGFPGWGFNEMILFFGVFYLIEGFYSLTCSIDGVASEIRSGELDNILVKPYSFIVAAFHFNLYSLGVFTAGLLMLIYSMIRLKLVFNLLDILIFLVFFATGYLVHLTVDLIIVSLSFFVTRTHSICSNFKGFKWEFSRWPMNLYPHGLRLFFTFIFPIIFLSFVPASFLLSKDFNKGFYAGPLIVSVVFLIVLKCFKLALRKYTSAGS